MFLNSYTLKKRMSALKKDLISERKRILTKNAKPT